MRSRRATLALCASTLAAVAGCAGDPSAGPEPTPGGLPDPVADGPVRAPADDRPRWTPAWTRPFDGLRVLGLDAAEDTVFATLSADGGPAGVAAVDPADGSVGWQQTLPGESVGAPGPADGWGVTVGDDALYAVTGNVEDRAWSAVRALARSDGSERWSLRRNRRLAVRGVAGDLVVVTATAFEERPPPTDASPSTDAPRSTRVLGVDAASGSVRWTREFDGVADVAVGTVAAVAADGLTLLERDGSRRGRCDRGPGRQVGFAGDRGYYLTGEDESGVLYGLPPTGETEWRQSLPVQRFVVGPDRLFAAGEGVFAVDPDGTVVWRDDGHAGRPFLGPGGETLYARTGGTADRATAYGVGGTERWTVTPESRNAWPAAATRDAAVVQAVTGETAEEPFYTVYVVDAEGRATASRGVDTVFDVIGHDGRFYLGDGEGRILAFDP